VLLTIDAFSGNRNPSLSIPSVISQRIYELLSDLGFTRGASQTSFPGRLGYRGLNIQLPQNITSRYRVPPWLNIPATAPATHLPMLRELSAVLQLATALPFGQILNEILKVIRAIIDAISGKKDSPAASSSGPTPCPYDMLPFDPKPWNDPAFIAVNNCYAYATNKRAKYADKPQPGIASGAIYSSTTGAAVATAARNDGAHDANVCFPDTEKPRHLVALVIWPGMDYHWYRKHPDCWGHKPGSTPAKNIDDSGKIILDPSTCNRGPYTIFHGYMLIPNSQKVAA
jgi:hypothetical protein